MAYTDYLDLVEKLYIAYYQRPADHDGLVYWATQIDKQGGSLEGIVEAFAYSPEAEDLYGGTINENNIENVITAIYNAAFNRDPDPVGLQFYVNGFKEGRFTTANILLSILDGAVGKDKEILERKIEAAEKFLDAVNELSNSPYEIKYKDPDVGRQFLKQVDVSDNVDVSVIKDFVFKYVDPVHTLKEPVPSIHTPNYQLFVQVGDEPSSKDIPWDMFISLYKELAGIDYAELGTKLLDGIDPKIDLNLTGNAESTFKGGSSDSGDESADDYSGFITTNDATNNFPSQMSLTGEAFFIDRYFDMIKTILTSGDKLRVYAKDISESTSESETHVILTPTQNNGSTYEGNTTGDDPDYIVAGRLELLHNAYIDAGGGYDILEIEAKGIFAQPLQLLNIEEIRIENVPNVYGDSGKPGDVQIQDETSSTIDLSHANSLQKLVITEGVHMPGIHAGDLYVVGIKGDAVVHLEGGFTGNVYLDFGFDMSNAVNLELNLGETSNFHLGVAHNTTTLNITSMGSENWLKDANLGGHLANLNISGDAPLYIEGDLSESFLNNRPVTINAKENSGGVHLTLNNHNGVVNFLGGDANDVFESKDSDKVIIQDTGGDNVFDLSGTKNIEVTTGSGKDKILALNGDNGDGVNMMIMDGREQIPEKVNIGSGEGADEIFVRAQDITIDAGAGDDVIYVSGAYNEEGVENGALLNISGGEGSDIVRFGADAGKVAEGELPGVTALEGSKISAEKLYIDEDTNLVQAQLEGVESVVLEQDANLTITYDQLKQIGSENFSVHRGVFGQNAVITVVITEDTDLTATDAVDLSKLDSNIRLKFQIMDDKTLTLSAEQLDKYIAEDGINVSKGFNGNVVLKGAALDFNPFDNNVDGVDEGGGTLNPIFENSDDLVIIRDPEGYSRPKPDESVDKLTIESTGQEARTIDTEIKSDARTLEIVGDKDVIFAKSATVELGDNFVVDWSQLKDATVQGLTIKNFERITAAKDSEGNPDPDHWGKIVGNGTPGTRVNIELSKDAIVGFDDVAKGGFHSEGVEQYVVTNLNGGHSTIYVCDTTKDVKVLGLQGNQDGWITFKNVKWDVSFLLEGDGSADWTERPKADGNPDESNIGKFEASFFWPGATANVNINNQGVTLEKTSTGTDRPLVVEGLIIDNAQTINVNVSDGDLILKDIDGDQVDQLIFTSQNDVTVKGGLVDIDDTLDLLDASKVDGTFMLVLNKDAETDLSHVQLKGVEGIQFASEQAELTLTADQIVDLGIAVFSEIDADNDGIPDQDGILNVVDLADQSLDLSKIQVNDIGDVSIKDVDGIVTLASDTNLTGADSLNIVAKESDTTVVMTASQFQQLDGTGKVTAEIGDDPEDFIDGKFEATLVINNLSDTERLDFKEVSNDIQLVVQLDGVTAQEDDPATPLLNEQFAIMNGNNIRMEVVSGDNDLSKAQMAGIETVVFTKEDATLTLTAKQVYDIGVENFLATDAAKDKVTLNIVDYQGKVDMNNDGVVDAKDQLDLDKIKDAGIDIGTITVVPDGVTVWGTLGGADKIIVTTDGDDKADSLTLTAEQFLDTKGVVDEQAAEGTEGGKADVHITDLTDGIGDDTTPVYIDLSQVNVSGEKDIRLATNENDVEFDKAADLGNFKIILNDIDSNNAVPDEMAGQTIRFASVAQANGRVIEVEGADANHGERDTNVVWLFDDLPQGVTQIDTSGYDSEIGRLWINDKLADGRNVEDLYTRLSSDTYVHVVNTQELGKYLPRAIGFDRHVEVEAFAQLPEGIIFSDSDKLQFVENLTIDLGGEVRIGNIQLDNILADNVTNDDEFGILIINSYLAGSGDTHQFWTHLLPQGFDPDVNPYPEGKNVIGDISSGEHRDELPRVIINTAAQDGVEIEVGTISFAEDADKDDTQAVLTLAGENDVTIEALDTSDPEITELLIDTTNFDGTLTITGGSAAIFADNTEKVVINTTDEDINLGTEEDKDGNPYAGIAGEELSTVEVQGNGDVDLGIIAQVDSKDFTLTANKGADITATLGKANVGNLIAPELASEGTWTISNVDELTITGDVKWDEYGTLKLNNIDKLIIDGDVDLTPLVDNPDTKGVVEGVSFNNVEIYVKEGSSLTLTGNQVDGLPVTGKGTLYLTGDVSKADLSHVTIPNIDFSQVTNGINIDVSAQSVDYHIVGSPYDDNIITGKGSDTIEGGKGDDVINAGAGDDIIKGGEGNDTIIAGDGADAIDGGVGNDTITADDGKADVIKGGDGDDIINAEDVDTIDGGDGTDKVNFSSDVSAKNLVDDHLKNVENIVITNNKAGTYDFSAQTEKLNITGSAHNDTIAGGKGADVINAGDGNDVIVGFAGADQIDGGNGIADILRLDTTSSDFNKATDDQVKGIEQIDLRKAESGVELDVSNQSENWVIFGSDHDDTIKMGDKLDENDVIDGGKGNDTLYFTDSNKANNDLNGVTNVEKIVLGDADTDIKTVNQLVAAGATLEVDASAFSNNHSLTWDGSAELDGSFNITGGDGNDIIIGGAGNDTITGGDGDDTLNGGAGNDTITGGAGNDTIDAGKGADTIDAGAGNDTITADDGVEDKINAGDGNDTINAEGVDVIDGGKGTDTVNFSGDVSAKDLVDGDLQNIENIVIKGGTTHDFSAQTEGLDVTVNVNNNETLTMGKGDDIIRMGNTLTGADTIDAGAGNDTLYFTDNGTTTDDLDHVTNVEKIVLGDATTNVTTVDALVAKDATLTVDGSALKAAHGLTWDASAEADGSFNITGGAGADTLIGGKGDDTLIGGEGDDTLVGNRGSDILEGGKGADILEGKHGEDYFIFSNGSGNTDTVIDEIKDFATGTDSIKLTGLVDGTNQNYTEVDGSGHANLAAVVAAANAAFGGNADLRYYVEYDVNNSGDGYLVIDWDGDHDADQAIHLMGVGAADDIDYSDIIGG